jgi:hypothetical protein
MGEMMMKIGATKPVMKDTRPILKGVSRARGGVEKENNWAYSKSIYRICTESRTEGQVDRAVLFMSRDVFWPTFPWKADL